MRRMEHVDQLLAGPAVGELHALLWTKPRVNKGKFDPGWSCREHAAAIAALLTLEGVHVRIRHGRSVFMQGATGNAPPVGFGQEASDGFDPRPRHTWTWVDGLGDLDVSPRLQERLDRWRPLDTRFGILGSTWPVTGLQTDAVVCTTRADYENAVNRASHLRDAGRAIYLVEREEPFEPGLLIDGRTRLDSPLTPQVMASAGPNGYVKLVVHVRGVLAGQRRSLASVSFGRAWQLIGQIPDREADALVQDLEAALSRNG